MNSSSVSTPSRWRSARPWRRSATDKRSVSGGNAFAGWYIAPGYGLTSTGTGRWEKGQRHAGGRNWTCCDGHAKWTKDPGWRDAAGTLKTQLQLMEEYRLKGLYTYPETDSSN